VLSEFRGRLVAGEAVAQLLDTVLAHGRTQGLLKAGSRQRTDSTHVLASIRVLNRLECVVETLRAALNALAVAAPAWLRTRLPAPAGGATWLERDAARAEDSRLPPTEATRTAFAHTVGADGHALLAAATAPNAPAWLREVPAVEMLRQVWLQQYYVDPAGQVRWRTPVEGWVTQKMDRGRSCFYRRAAPVPDLHTFTHTTSAKRHL
jgi:hypothetical protein